MVFEEKDYIDVTNEPMNFIYFLCDDVNSVLYVGKTTQGLSRINAHRKSEKLFTQVYIIPCKYEELDTLEISFIEKYRPVYNTAGTENNRIKISNIGKLLKMQLSLSRNFTIKDIYKMLCEEDYISIYVIAGIEYITIDDYFILKDRFEDLLKGAPQNDVFYL